MNLLNYNPLHMQAARIVLLFFLSLSTLAQVPNKKPNFPTIDEIQLTISQADRAFQQYGHAVIMEADLPTMQEDKTAINRDTEVVASAKKLVSGLTKRPEVFNGPGGLLLLGILDDASRNAALCSASAFADISTLVMTKGVDSGKVYKLMNIGQACQDASVQLYTVSENVHALLLREMESQQTLNDQAVEAINLCTSALNDAKKSSVGIKK